jgi:hypothetical protein
MLNKTWAFALALALAAAPVSSLLAAGGTPSGENATAGTAAANASTPAAKTDPAGAKPSSPEAGDLAASNTGSTRTSTPREPVNNKLLSLAGRARILSEMRSRTDRLKQALTAFVRWRTSPRSVGSTST